MSVTTMLRAVKKPQDEWMTPKYAVRPLLPYLKPHSNIMCPFDKMDSAFKDVLESNEHIVFASHINEGFDFFKFTKKDVARIDYIISNPPYSIKDKVFEHLFYLGKPFAMLMGATAGLFEGKRFNLFKDKELEIMWLRPRIAYMRENGEVVKSPPFQSCYVCHRVLPKQYLFVEVVRK